MKNTVLFQSVSLQERVNFARHLHLTMQAGLALVDGLRLVLEQSSSQALKRIIRGLIADINSGRFLSEGLQRHRDVFGSFFISVVEIGEKSGNLSESLLHLSEELRKKKRLHAKIRAALIYPVIILVATVAITLFLVFFVLPKILPILKDLRVELPATTRFLIALVDLFSAHGLYLIGGGALVLVGIRLLLRVRLIRFISHRALLSVPIVSRLAIGVTVVDFTRSLGLLLKSGVTIVDALTISAGGIRNTFYQREILRAAEHVRKGEQIARYLSKRKSFFPPMVVNLIQIGETTGHLEQNLLYLAGFYEEEVSDSVRGLTSVLEPLLLLTMGILVGFVAISIILPIYKISTPSF